jgi:hypothetical protein
LVTSTRVLLEQSEALRDSRRLSCGRLSIRGP